MFGKQQTLLAATLLGAAAVAQGSEFPDCIEKCLRNSGCFSAGEYTQCACDNAAEDSSAFLKEMVVCMNQMCSTDVTALDLINPLTTSCDSDISESAIQEAKSIGGLSSDDKDGDDKDSEDGDDEAKTTASSSSSSSTTSAADSSATGSDSDSDSSNSSSSSATATTTAAADSSATKAASTGDATQTLATATSSVAGSGASASASASVFDSASGSGSSNSKTGSDSDSTSSDSQDGDDASNDDEPDSAAPASQHASLFGAVLAVAAVVAFGF
ncbi:hypothetical protein F4780DRAFT_774819 [Xylariomycetidae sp. FL0641]|nr:hypothetical protein F4780DRAFT_774819 [Xylariomycetidae sp. FL0641]